ncbi:MAG: esterase-like activity of phytase family protein [Pseudomonadota bacterium]|nr:esterase-like activity of phytase family protein [Pseudomonadota bacterium]
MMRSALLALGLALAVQAAAVGQAVEVTPVPLNPDASEDTRTGRLDYRGGIAIASDDERFGGLSALELSSDGTRLLALSDSAWWITGSLDWSDEGNRLTGFSGLQIAPVRDAGGAHFEGRSGDSEGLAPLGNGRYAISFEREHRMLAYDLGTDWSRVGEARPEPLHGPEELAGLPDNRGAESLARTATGTLLMGIEYPTDITLAHHLWVGDGTGWRRLALNARPSFGLTGMAAHDGTIYALERFYSRAVGNRAGIIAFPVPGPDDTAIAPVTIGRIDPPMTVDNFEGIAVIERGGETLILILSDDNFSRRQRTLLMAFAVVE